MLETLNVGHVLIALAALDALAALLYAAAWRRHKDELRGTPLYARGRDARRLTLWLGASALLLLFLACLTPLGAIPLVGEGAPG